MSCMAVEIGEGAWREREGGGKRGGEGRMGRGAGQRGAAEAGEAGARGERDGEGGGRGGDQEMRKNAAGERGEGRRHPSRRPYCEICRKASHNILDDIGFYDSAGLGGLELRVSSPNIHGNHKT